MTLTPDPDICSSHLQRKLKGFIKEGCTTASAVPDPCYFGSSIFLKGQTRRTPPFGSTLSTNLLSQELQNTFSLPHADLLVAAVLTSSGWFALFCGFKHSYCPAYGSGRRQAAIKQLGRPSSCIDHTAKSSQVMLVIANCCIDRYA